MLFVADYPGLWNRLTLITETFTTFFEEAVVQFHAISFCGMNNWPVIVTVVSDQNTADDPFAICRGVSAIRGNRTNPAIIDRGSKSLW